MPQRDVGFARVYLPFAAGYLLSYVFRSGTAVISPELTRELALSPAALGLLTSAYFLAFGVLQLPAGILLDRYGPRRVEPVFMLIAGVGSLAFALAGGETGLLFARALIGVGAATCLMAPLKGIVTWFPSRHHASMSGWMMVAGGLGALLVTVPLELALRVTTWRSVFVALAIACFAVAWLIWWRVPDTARPQHPAGAGAQWKVVWRVFRTPRFWWIGPLGGFAMGSFAAVQGLWSVPWLMEVQGLDRAIAARHLLVMSIVTLFGYVLLGAFATRVAQRGIGATHLFAGGFVLNLLGFAAIVAEIPGSYFWWALYGFGASVNVLGFTVLNEGLPSELAARANTALNLLMFVGSFLSQWGIGLVVELVRRRFDLDIAGALRIAFVVVLALEVVTYAWFVLGWRQHARRVPVLTPAG